MIDELLRHKMPATPLLFRVTCSLLAFIPEFYSFFLTLYASCSFVAPGHCDSVVLICVCTISAPLVWALGLALIALHSSVLHLCRTHLIRTAISDRHFRQSCVHQHTWLSIFNVSMDSNLLPLNTSCPTFDCTVKTLDAHILLSWIEITWLNLDRESASFSLPGIHRITLSSLLSKLFRIWWIVCPSVFSGPSRSVVTVSQKALKSTLSLCFKEGFGKNVLVAIL